MNLTSVDPPEIIRFVKQNYPEVELIRPKDSIYNIAIQKRILPTQRVRWCCEEFKESAGAGKVTLIGIRKQESARRKKRNEVEISSRKFSGTLEGLDEYRKSKGINITNATEERTMGCISGKESLLVSPIIHWAEQDVWEFLNEVVQVPHCELYDQGWTRIGCIGCPMAQLKQKVKENKRWPHVKRNWIKAIKAIRMGGYQKANLHRQGAAFAEGYVWWNIPSDLTPCRNVGSRLRQTSSQFLPKGNLETAPPYQQQHETASTRDFGPGFRKAPRLTA